MARKEKRTQLVERLRFAGAIVLAFPTAVFLLGGMKAICDPSWVDPSSLMGRHAPYAAWTMFIVATLIICLTVDGWVKALPAMLAVGTFNSVVMIWTGHVTGNLLVSVPRVEAVTLTVVFAVATVLSITFRFRNLNVIDRISLLVFLYSMAWSTLTHNSAAIFRALGVGLFGLAAGWSYHHFRHRRGGDLTQSRLVTGERTANL